MLRYIVIDDEPLAREGITLNANKIDYLNEIGSFPNAITASEFLSSYEVDLIFLDIEMPGLNGLDFLRSLNHKPFVILTTAYPQFALEAFELEVMDYLIKPIKFDRFFKAVKKVNDYHALKAKGIDALDLDNQYLYIKSDRQYMKIFLKDVIYIKGMKDYIVIHTAEGKYMTAMNVKTILSKLPKKLFARVSKSYIVQTEHIKSIGTDTIYTNDYELPLGPSYKEAFIQKYVKTNLISR